MQLQPEQPSLFAEEAPRAYVPNPRHVRNRLQSLLDEMRAAETWPWDISIIKLYRDTVMPRLCDELPDAEEAAHWRGLIATEIARFDAA